MGNSVGKLFGNYLPNLTVPGMSLYDGGGDIWLVPGLSVPTGEEKPPSSSACPGAPAAGMLAAGGASMGLTVIPTLPPPPTVMLAGRGEAGWIMAGLSGPAAPGAEAAAPGSSPPSTTLARLPPDTPAAAEPSLTLDFPLMSAETWMEGGELLFCLQEA